MKLKIRPAQRICCFLVPAMLMFGKFALAVDLPFDRGDGRVTFYNYHTGEVLEVTYRNKDKYDEGALKKINNLFRSRSDNKEIIVDVALIELLDNVQDHFGAGTIELISGYRSPELNRALKKRGANVAEESMHLEGKAADIHMDEVTEEAVAEYARSLKAGGVGYYPALDFVHIDTGEPRSWSLPDRPGRLLMAFRKNPDWQVITSKDVYLPGQKIVFEITNITRMEETFFAAVHVERYHQGKWTKLNEMNSCAGRELKAGGSCRGELAELKEPGKYRLAVDSIPKAPHLRALSNEFYIKKM